MKFSILSAFLMLLPLTAFSQIQGEDEVYLTGDRIEAQFNGGGIENFSKFIDKEFDYSKVTKAGKLEVTFTIDEEGNVKNIKITQILDIESATELIRVLKKCPKWEPAKRGGKPFSVDIKYPMVFNEKVKTNESQPLAQEAINKNGTDSNQSKSPGIGQFYDYIRKCYRSPDVPGLKGKVVVSFVINEDGSLGDFKILRDIGYGAGKELIKVLAASPKWNPGTKDGKPVKVKFTLPVLIDNPNE